MYGYRLLTGILIIAVCLAGCVPPQSSDYGVGSAVPSMPTASPTRTDTSTPTSSPVPATLTPTATRRPTYTPYFTFTPAPMPTSSLAGSGALDLKDTCRQVIDELYLLRAKYPLSNRLIDAESQTRQPGDFNPNEYFNIFTHLKMASGYSLDFLYFGDELGGMPMLYARKINQAPFKTYEEYLQSFGEELSGERSYESLDHSSDFLEKVEIDGTPESYLEYMTLAYLGDQFYLWWHGLYNDFKILCDSSGLQYVEEDMHEMFELEFPEETAARIEIVDFTPALLIEDDTETLRIITFTKWGGFFENLYVLSKGNPVELLDVQFNSLIEYDCDVNF